MENNDRPTVDSVLRDQRSADERAHEYVSRRKDFLESLQHELGITEKYTLIYSPDGLLPGINVNDAYAQPEAPAPQKVHLPVADASTPDTPAQPEATPAAEEPAA